MARQILPQQPSFMSGLGESFASSLTEALQQKMADDMEEKKQAQETKRMRSSLGTLGKQVGGEQGALLTALSESEDFSPELVQSILPQILRGSQEQIQSQQQAQQYYNMMGISPPGPQQPQPQQPQPQQPQPGFPQPQPQIQQQPQQQLAQQPVEINEEVIESVKASPFFKKSDEELAILAKSPNKVIASAAQAGLKIKALERQEQEMKLKELQSLRSFHSPQANKFLDKVNESGDSAEDQLRAVNLMKNSLAEGAQTFGSKDWLADRLGWAGTGLRTAKGAQFDLGLKDFLISGISKVGPRPNQWIEQQIAKMLPRRGYSEAANLSILAPLEAAAAIKKNFSILGADMAQAEYESKGYIPFDINNQVKKKSDEYAKKVNDKLSYNLQKFEDSEIKNLASAINKKVSKGTPLTLERAQALITKYKEPQIALKIAKKLGYSIPSTEEIEYYTQEGY